MLFTTPHLYRLRHPLIATRVATLTAPAAIASPACATAAAATATASARAAAAADDGDDDGDPQDSRTSSTHVLMMGYVYATTADTQGRTTMIR